MFGEICLQFLLITIISFSLDVYYKCIHWMGVSNMSNYFVKLK